MANFINSSKILMYPSAFRAVNPESYLNTEFNLTNTKRLSSFKELNSYIINQDDYYVNFCINGYFFKIKYEDLNQLGRPLYAYIILKNENSQDVYDIDEYNNLRLTVVNPIENTESTFGVLDINNEFRGLAFTNSSQEIKNLEDKAGKDHTFEIHFIQLLGDSGDVVGNKFKLSSLEIRDSLDIDKSIYEHFTTQNLDVGEKLTAKDVEITNSLKATNETQLYLLEVSENATLKKDLTLCGKLNGVAIESNGGAEVTFASTSAIENSKLVNVMIGADENGISLEDKVNNNGLHLPFNPSSTTGKNVLVNTSGTSSWVTLSDTAVKSSVVYRDANGDSFFNELFTKNIYVKMPESSGLSSLNPMPSMFNAALKKIDDKYVIEFLNLQKIFAAGISSNDSIDTAKSNYFISSLAMSPDGQLKLKASTLVPPTEADVVGGVKVSEVCPNTEEYRLNNILKQTSLVRPAFVTGDGYLVTELITATNDKYGVVKIGYQIDRAKQNYPVELDSSGRMFVNVPWDSGTDTTYDSGNGLYLDNTTNKLHIKTNFKTNAAERKYKTQVDTTSNSPYTEIPVADSDNYGVVKIGFSDQPAAKLYGVKFSLDNHLYVEVPWISTPATTTELGLVKVGGVRTIGDSYIESANSTSGRFYKVERDSATNKLFVNVPWTDTTYSVATSSDLGLVRIGYTKSGKNYPVQLNSNNQMYVNVPWDDDTDTGATSVEVTGSGNAVTSASYTASTRKLTLNKGTTFLTSHLYRPIKVKGTQILANSSSTALDLQAGTNIEVSNSGGVVTYKTVASPEFTSITLTSTSQSLTASGPISATSFTATSDIRKKENIEEFKYTKSILDLPIKKFDFIDGPKNQIGCIAQDLQKLYPELVQEDAKGYLSINESKLVYLLIEEVRQLKKELKQVKNDVLFLN